MSGIVGKARGFFGGKWLLIGLAIALTAAVLIYILFWKWAAPTWGRRGEPPATAAVARPFSFPNETPPAAPRQNPATMPQAVQERAAPPPLQYRPRPSQFGFDAIRAKPKAAVIADNGRGPDQIAGLPVLRAEGLHDSQWYLMPGTSVACHNYQIVDGSGGQNFRVQIESEIRGADGTQVLVPKDSWAIGSVNKAAEYGDTRIAMQLTHIVGPTPAGSTRPSLIVPLGNAQGQDEMGRAGMPANVNNDFWGRFGNVAAYAVLDAGVRAAGGIAAYGMREAITGGIGDGVNVNINPTFGGALTTQSLGGMAMRRELNRPPSITTPQAQPCSIFIKNPINFGPYYGARTRSK